MSNGEAEVGLSDHLLGQRWQSAAGRGVAIFVCAYVLPAFLLAPDSHPAALLQMLASVLAFVFIAGALYRFLRERFAGFLARLGRL